MFSAKYWIFLFLQNNPVSYFLKQKEMLSFYIGMPKFFKALTLQMGTTTIKCGRLAGMRKRKTYDWGQCLNSQVVITLLQWMAYGSCVFRTVCSLARLKCQDFQPWTCQVYAQKHPWIHSQPCVEGIANLPHRWVFQPTCVISYTITVVSHVKKKVY